MELANKTNGRNETESRFNNSRYNQRSNSNDSKSKKDNEGLNYNYKEHNYTENNIKNNNFITFEDNENNNNTLRPPKHKFVNNTNYEDIVNSISQTLVKIL
jgi:hypothetical protein